LKSKILSFLTQQQINLLFITPELLSQLNLNTFPRTSLVVAAESCNFLALEALQSEHLLLLAPIAPRYQLDATAEVLDVPPENILLNDFAFDEQAGII